MLLWSLLIIMQGVTPQEGVETTTLDYSTTILTTDIMERDTCLYKNKRPGFICDNGECIDNGRICDQKEDCSDGSDESIDCCPSTCITPSKAEVCIANDGHNHTNSECRDCTKSGYPGFRCDNGACIYRRKVCDGRSQCADNSDEKYCAFHLCQTMLGSFVNVPRDLLDPSGDCRKCDYNSKGDGWRCNNAKCILQAWKCDGSKDCSDGSDEEEPLCNPEKVEQVEQVKLDTSTKSTVTPEASTVSDVPATVSSQVSGPCPDGWMCTKYTNCSQFDGYINRGGLFADLRCSSDNLSWICCDPSGQFSEFGTDLTDYGDV